MYIDMYEKNLIQSQQFQGELTFDLKWNVWNSLQVFLRYRIRDGNKMSSKWTFDDQNLKKSLSLSLSAHLFQIWRNLRWSCMIMYCTYIRWETWKLQPWLSPAQRHTPSRQQKESLKWVPLMQSKWSLMIQMVPVWHYKANVAVTAAIYPQIINIPFRGTLCSDRCDCMCVSFHSRLFKSTNNLN